ncbi:MAG: hypothetical protein V7L21_14590 [Nostoc sp.]|uniref:hypothetical protein n=1 Tax=Nostoc sp. TaxID=1180 RepID=UPI002FFC59EE|nr:hypothetical protein [Nostoc sp. NMS9]
MIAAVVRPLNLVVALLRSCCFLLTSCHPTQMKSKASLASQGSFHRFNQGTPVGKPPL